MRKMKMTVTMRRMTKMATDVLIIISFLCLLCIFFGMCLLSVISDKLSKIITILEEIKSTPNIFPTKIEKGYGLMDSNVFYIHYNKDKGELEKLRK